MWVKINLLFLQLVVERSKAGFPAIVSQTETLDDDVDANVLMKRIVRKACLDGKEKCESKIRFEMPSGHSLVNINIVWYSSVIKHKNVIAQCDV